MKQLWALGLLVMTFNIQATDKAIYGSFDSEFISSKTPASIAKLASGVAYISYNAYSFSQNNGYTLISGTPLKDSVNLCPDQAFAKSMSLHSVCTGFLIAPDVLLTAGHCISTQSTCDRVSISFGVTQRTETSNGFMIPDNSVYQCQRVLKYSDEPASDYSIVKLNRKVKGRHIFSLGNDQTMELGSRAFMIGHPMGLAQTYSKAAPVVNVSDKNFLKITLDSFGGNSGGPVIDSQTHKVIGLLIRGASDFKPSPGKSCRDYATYPDNGYGEWVYRINEVKATLKNYQIL